MTFLNGKDIFDAGTYSYPKGKITSGQDHVWARSRLGKITSGQDVRHPPLQQALFWQRGLPRTWAPKQVAFFPTVDESCGNARFGAFCNNKENHNVPRQLRTLMPARVAVSQRAGRCAFPTPSNNSPSRGVVQQHVEQTGDNDLYIFLK
eukprot:gene7354-biopygen4547